MTLDIANWSNFETQNDDIDSEPITEPVPAPQFHAHGIQEVVQRGSTVYVSYYAYRRAAQGASMDWERVLVCQVAMEISGYRSSLERILRFARKMTARYQCGRMSED